MLQGFSAGTESPGGGGGEGGGGGGGGGEGGGGGGGDGAAAGEKRLVNLITITGEEQVALKVTIAEVEREVAKQLGINIAGSFSSGGFSIGSVTGLSPIPFSAGGEIEAGYTGRRRLVALGTT